MPRPVLGKMLLAQAESEPYRKNTRIPMVMPITVRGQDNLGSAFEERTETIDVSRKGMKTSVIHALPADSQVRISNGNPNKALPARVVWLGHSDRPEERAQIGVEFLGPHETGNIWTIESPPDDWVDEDFPLTATQKLEYYWARATTAQKLPDLQGVSDVGQPLADPLPPGAMQGVQEVKAADSQEKEIIWEEIKADAIKSPPPAKSVTLSVQPTAWDDRVPAPPSQASMEIIERGLRSVEIPRTAPAKPEGTLRLNSPGAALNQLAQILCEQAETITKGVERAVTTVNSAADQSITKLELTRQQIEVQLGTANLEHQKRLALINSGNADALRKNSEALLADFQSDLQRRTEDQLQVTKAEHQRQLAALAVSNVQLVRDVASSFKDACTRQLEELKTKDLELRQLNEGYMRTYEAMVRGEIDAAKSTMLRRAILTAAALLVVMTVSLFGFAYFSTQPVMRLRADPTAEFVDPNVSPEFRDAEAQLARAYWNSAVHDVQRTYKFRAALPDEPPPDFRIQPTDAVSTYSKVYVDASRGRYWQRLRSIWDNPQAWELSYEWNSGWIASPLKSLGQMLRR